MKATLCSNLKTFKTDHKLQKGVISVESYAFVYLSQTLTP